MTHRVRVVILLFFCATSLSANALATRNNDDSCDIAVLPAATLLLPYFEVALNHSETTLFTVTNASPEEQIAHVTLWTDYAFPVLSFDIYLTGYDVQSINLYDVIWRGVVAPDFGTGTASVYPEPGDFSVDNPALDLRECSRLPGALPAVYVQRMQSAFTLGRVPASGPADVCNLVGSPHQNAVGYATIDVVRACGTSNPSVAGYLTDSILWDNVLLGDYQQISTTNNYAQGSTMVHVRAIPEGGTAIERRNLPQQYSVVFHRTFYSRFLPPSNQTFDARQPLPALFAVRWIYGSQADFRTSLKIWREGRTTLNAPCASHVQNVAGFIEVVTFDEEENAEDYFPDTVICTPIITYPLLPATSFVSVNDAYIFPRPSAGNIAGWIYLNLDNCAADNYASQNWVTVSMRAEGRFSTDIDAFGLGNGCSPPYEKSEVTAGDIQIGPAGNVNP